MIEPWQWALAFIAAFFVGLSKTGIAGIGILSVALFASIFPARESVGIVLVTLIAGDIVAIASYRREANWPQLLRLFPWAAIGVVVGALALGRIDSSMVQRLIGGILVALVVFQYVRRWITREGTEQREPPRSVAIVTGLLAGFTTMIANASGPIMIMYLLAMRLPKLVFIGTAAWFFFALNLFKVPFSYGLGMINPTTLVTSLWLAPFAIAGAIVGRLVIKYINQSLFETLALVLTAVAGLRLLLM